MKYLSGLHALTIKYPPEVSLFAMKEILNSDYFILYDSENSTLGDWGIEECHNLGDKVKYIANGKRAIFDMYERGDITLNEVIKLLHEYNLVKEE